MCSSRTGERCITNSTLPTREGTPVPSNHGILWDAIQWGCENGYHTLDMGRSDLDGEGLLKYKRSWGTTESDLTYVRFTDQPTEIRSGEGGAVVVESGVASYARAPAQSTRKFSV